MHPICSYFTDISRCTVNKTLNFHHCLHLIRKCGCSLSTNPQSQHYIKIVGDIWRRGFVVHDIQIDW
jgi:hypothetical protein